MIAKVIAETCAQTFAGTFNVEGFIDVLILLSCELEVAVGRPLTPSPLDRTVVVTDVLHLAIRGDMNLFGGLVLHISFEAHGPFGYIHGDDRRRGIRTGVKDALDLFAVPGHHQGDWRSLGWRRPPIAIPGARQRMSLLGEIRRGHAQTRPETTQVEYSSVHGRIIPLLLQEKKAGLPFRKRTKARSGSLS